MPTAAPIPSLSADQMREVDRVMIEELHITLLQMMENAGRGLAELTMRQFKPRTVTVLAGPGGNGGGGLAAARHLANRGCQVSVILAVQPAELNAAAAHQRDILRRMGVEVLYVVVVADADADADADVPPRLMADDVIIDSLIGYSLRGDPRGPIAAWIRWANASEAAIVSLDCPSGLDVTTGELATPCVRASATLTLALPKHGLYVEAAKVAVGELYLGDISVPVSVYDALGVPVAPTLFADGGVSRVAP